MMLSSSFAADLRPLKRPLFSAIDTSEGVVALELAWETLLEGAMPPNAGGLHPRPWGEAQVDIDGLKRLPRVVKEGEAYMDV